MNVNHQNINQTQATNEGKSFFVYTAIGFKITHDVTTHYCREQFLTDYGENITSSLVESLKDILNLNAAQQVDVRQFHCYYEKLEALVYIGNFSTYNEAEESRQILKNLPDVEFVLDVAASDFELLLVQIAVEVSEIGGDRRSNRSYWKQNFIFGGTIVGLILFVVLFTLVFTIRLEQLFDFLSGLWIIVDFA